MALTFADTDVLIDFLDQREPASSAVRRELSVRNLATTAVNEFELYSGAKDEKIRRALRAQLRVISVARLDSAGARAAAEIRRDLEAKGAKINMGDYLIAGIVLSNRGVLMTRNRRHFERVRGLRLLDVDGE